MPDCLPRDRPGDECQCADRRTLLRGVAAASVGAAVAFGAVRTSAAADERGGRQWVRVGRRRRFPVGGGLVLFSKNVVVTRPEQDVFKAFSSKCTHQGVEVNEVVGGIIRCPGHGSKFDYVTGEVVQGPATTPLPRRRVKVEEGYVFVKI